MLSSTNYSSGHDPSVEHALVLVAQYIPLRGQGNKPRREIDWLKVYFERNPPEKFINHKFLWPAHVRVVARYVASPRHFTLTADDCQKLHAIVDLLGPSS